jgi:uncharacterized protein YjiS (DUF1127 family)
MISTTIPLEQPVPTKCRRCPLLDTCRAMGARLCQARRTRTELSALSDVELRDIGLFRGDIDAVAMDNWR